MLINNLLQAQNSQGLGGSLGMMLLLFGVMFVFFILPQMRKQKKAKQFLETLKKGDKVVTQQVEFLLLLYQWLIAGSETFNILLEEIYASWYDDDKMMLKNIQKTVSSLSSNDTADILPPLKEGEEDMEFALDLVCITAEKNKEFEGMISEGTQNWDPERIAMLDLIMMKMAMCEFITFQNVPVKVTINEYLEIAKAYSTPNSAKFINGILDKLRIKLLDRKAIVKTGRGLIEN